MKLPMTLLLAAFFSITAFAQVSEDSELFITLKKQDSLFFSKSFNECDIDFLKAHISDDIKFYHDQGGLQDKAIFIDNVSRFICGPSDQKPIRKLTKGSLVVFPMYRNGELYAAIQKGKHNFYLRSEGKEDIFTSSADFTHVWLLEGDKWILGDVLSYNHQGPQE